METSYENGLTHRSMMDKTSCKMEPRPQLHDENKRSVGRPRKRWEDDINQVVRTDETKESKGSDMKKNDTWIRAAKEQKE